MISFHAPLSLCCCQACPIIVMFALYTSRKQGKLQRACVCGDSEIHVCRSGLPAQSHFTLNFTGADCGFLPPSFDSRVRIRLICPRRPSLMLSRTAARARSAQGASQFAAGYDDTGRAARKALILSKITTFRVVKTTTLILVK